MPFEIATDVFIPDSELSFAFMRASGPGGQNVNKVASAVQLRFDLAANRTLDDRVKQRLRSLAGRRVTAEGAILIAARTHRTQERNRADALERLRQLIIESLHPPRPRRATRPTKASKERRLVGKAHQQRRKVLRGRVRGDD